MEILEDKQEAINVYQVQCSQATGEGEKQWKEESRSDTTSNKMSWNSGWSSNLNRRNREPIREPQQNLNHTLQTNTMEKNGRIWLDWYTCVQWHQTLNLPRQSYMMVKAWALDLEKQTGYPGSTTYQLSANRKPQLFHL